MRPRKGQAAMEFLSTYGWAIMVVLVMIGALSYFGVINPYQFVPEKCVFSAGLTCKDFIAQTGASGITFKFVVENGLGETIIIPDGGIVLTYDGTAVSCLNTGSPFTLKAGEDNLFECTEIAGTYSAGQRVKARVDLNYTASGGVFSHPASGEIQARTQ